MIGKIMAKKSKQEFNVDDKIDSIKTQDAYKEKYDQVTIDRISEIYEVETRVAIVFAIDTFGSCNIKKLANILSKNEATIFHHLKSLIKEPAVIKLDEKMTLENKGKYYQLTEFAQKYFGSPFKRDQEKSEENVDQMKQIFKSLLKKSDDEISTFYIDLLRNHPNSLAQADQERKNLAYNHILEKLFVGNLEQAARAFNQNKKPLNSNYPMGSIANFSLEMKIAKTRHIIEILLFFAEINSQFYELQRKIADEMNDQNIPDDAKINLHYHIVGGEVETFEFK